MFGGKGFSDIPFCPALDRFFPAFRILPETEVAAVAIAVGVGLVSGLVPAIVAARTSVVDALARR